MISILLVEDDASLGKSLSGRLEKRGYEVILCRSIAQAKSALDEADFDIAILDVGLPDGDGFTLAPQIRKSDTPIVFLTAMNSPEFRLEAYELGAEDYIPKPFHLKELMLRIERVLKNNHKAVYIRHKAFLLNRESGEIRFENGSSEILQHRDATLLSLLLENTPQPVSREAVLESWQAGPGANARSIDNSITRLRQLLQENGIQAIKAIRGVGYAWIED